MRSEADFRRRLQRFLEAKGCWTYRFPDSPGTGRKPADLLVVHQGRTHLFECKVKAAGRQILFSTGSKALFPRRQVQALHRAETVGGMRALFLVNVLGDSLDLLCPVSPAICWGIHFPESDTKIELDDLDWYAPYLGTWFEENITFLADWPQRWRSGEERRNNR